MVLYCKKCGRQLPELFDEQTHDKCDVCGSKFYIVPDKYIDNFRWRDGDGKKAVEDELVKTSPEFDPDLFARRDDILHQRTEDFERKMAIGEAVKNGMNPKEALATNGNGYKNKPTCPTCGSTNVQKINVMSKVIGASMFGLFSKTAKSQFKCNDCGYKW